MHTTDFECLFATSDDPWQFRTRWYEQRKRDLILATLPRQTYPSVYEPACANGELSAALAPRCSALLCQDISPTAVKLARERLLPHPHVTVRHGGLLEDWPAGHFDLIVLGEVGYYLSSAQWARVIERTRTSLTTDGSVMACHWRHPIEGCPQDGDQVHALLAEHLHLNQLSRHEETDFLLECWSRQPHCLDLDEVVR